MMQDLPLEGPLDLAVRRLDQALAQLEARLEARRAAPSAASDGGNEAETTDLFGQAGTAAFAEDRTWLTAELESARAREKALEEVAAEASAALGRAAAEVRAALAAGEH
jgi:hypothetical protein